LDAITDPQGVTIDREFTKMPRDDGHRLDCLGRIRNALAHRKPAAPEDLRLAFRSNRAW
jgi:hypothetical protein